MCSIYSRQMFPSCKANRLFPQVAKILGMEHLKLRTCFIAECHRSIGIMIKRAVNSLSSHGEICGKLACGVTGRQPIWTHDFGSEDLFIAANLRSNSIWLLAIPEISFLRLLSRISFSLV
jgi:hypothetical protein